MQHAPVQDPPPNLEMSLREQLLAAGAAGSAPPSQYPPPPSAGQPGPEHPYQTADAASPHGHLDPSVAGPQAPYAQMSGDSGGDEGSSPQTGKGKRELSTSKRAAQNRAAQRAFRQRKEGYIKKLEEQVREFQTMEQNYRALQNENYQLREYILNLQSRLLETQSDYPPAPSHINLSSSAAAAAGSGAAASSSAAEQQLRREMQQPATQAREAPRQDDGYLNHLQAAAARAGDTRPQHESPYGLGADYANKRPRADELGSGIGDAKATQ